MKVALVTGATGGIGAAIAKRLLKDGYSVAITGRRQSALDDMTKECNTEMLLPILADAIDISSYPSILEQIFNHWGRLDVLINSVGGGTLGQTLGSVTPESWDSIFTLNTKSAFFMSQAALPALLASKGVILNFSSVLASRPVSGLGPYSAAKAAVDMLTQSMALELAPKGVRVVCIAPATIETNFHQAAGMSPAAADAYYKASASTHPIGRIGTPTDVAELAAFLIDSEKAGFLTGTTIQLDGGRLLTSATAAQLGTR
jgi:NAD(P)-dependent dehydrogenase (short-subunit alcohol dehydrogenase family)